MRDAIILIFANKQDLPEGNTIEGLKPVLRVISTKLIDAYFPPFCD